MFFALSLLLLASIASAQLDLSDRNDLRVDASVYIHAEVQNVFYRKAANTTAADRVVFGFAKGGLLLPIKDKLEDEKASEKNLAKPYFFSRATCVAVNLNQTGKVGLAKPAIVLDDIESTVFQYIDYSDFLIYSDFSRPFFEFEVTAFKQANVNSTSCTPVAADGTVTKQNFTERLCYTEDTFCNVWIGDNSDGWLYFGGGNTSTTANFGVQVFPRWNWSGSREEFTLNETNYLDVRPVDSLSDANGTFTLSKTYSVPFEFNDCKVQDDGVVVFNIDANGNLVRYLSCNSLQLSENAYFVFDFNNKFDEAKMAQWKLPGVDKWNFTLPPTVRVKYASTTSVRVDPDEYLEPWVELNRLPAPYELDGVNWLSTIEYRTGQFDLIRTWFTVVKRVTAAPGVPTTPGTTAAPTTTRPPAPTFVIRPCPNDCSGAGSCNTMTGQCTCDTGFIADAALGCKSNLETTGAGTTTTIATVAVETLLATTEVQVTQAPETQTQNVGLGTGTFTGTKAPTAGPRTTRPVATTAAPTTAGAAQLVLSFAALLLSLLVAF